MTQNCLKPKRMNFKSKGEKQNKTKNPPAMEQSSADLSAQILQARRKWEDIFTVLKERNCQPEHFTQQNCCSD